MKGFAKEVVEKGCHRLSFLLITTKYSPKTKMGAYLHVTKNWLLRGLGAGRRKQVTNRPKMLVISQILILLFRVIHNIN
jgi:hypothetical protein